MPSTLTAWTGSPHPPGSWLWKRLGRLIPVDILLLATEDEAYTRNPVPRAKTLLLQRDWRQRKRSRAFDLAEHPVLALLAEGSATVLDIVGRIPQFSADLVINLVQSLYDRRVVHLIPPAELARYGVSVPRESLTTAGEEVRIARTPGLCLRRRDAGQQSGVSSNRQ